MSIQPATALTPPEVLARDPSPVGAQMRWALAVLEGTDVTPDDDERFVGAFHRRHPGGPGPLLAGWRAAGPHSLRGYTSVAHKAWATLEAHGGTLTLASTSDSSGRLRLLTLTPERPLPPLGSWPDVQEVLSGPGVATSVLAARRRGGVWETLHAHRADVPRPAGSTYKLYVLDAVAEAAAAGTATWDTALVVRDHLRSLPTGELQDRPAGSTCTVAEAAVRMIAMSDNTAADLLMDLVGRESVEQSLVRLGHRWPEVLVPFPASRELFQTGWGDPALREAWKCADARGRRALLEKVGSEPLTVGTADMTDAVHLLGLDWHMSAWDIARALTTLLRRADDDPDGVVAEAMMTNTGVPTDPGRWRRTAFKGGSNPGLLSFCWLLERDPDDVSVLVLQQSAADPEVLRDSWTPLRVARAAIGDLM